MNCDESTENLYDKNCNTFLLKKELIEGFELTGKPLPKAKGKAPVKGVRMSKKDKARAAAKKEIS